MSYVLRALKDIELEMRRASEELKDALFIEYWGESGSLANRIAKWLANADT